jgi:hypothetical protein
VTGVDLDTRETEARSPMTDQEIDNLIRERLRESGAGARRLATIAGLASVDRTRTGRSLMRLMQQGHVVYNGRGAYRAVR